MAPCDSLRRLASEARARAMEKSPVKSPLIVQTALYTSIAIEQEILGVAVNAPFGSGKTVGIGLKSYHDSREGYSPMRNSRVILLRVRLLKEGSPVFWSYLRSNVQARVLCGGPIVTALWLVAKHYEQCSDPGNKGCYTTITREEARGILNVLEGSELGRRAQRVPDVPTVTGLLGGVRRVLGGRPLYVIIDEVEGFLDILGPRSPGELVFSNMAFAARLYDEGVRDAKLVLLVQSAHIGEEWERIVRAVKEGVPYPSMKGSPRVYECSYGGGAKERLGTEAIAGRVHLRSMRYYNENVYLHYIRSVLQLAYEECGHDLYDSMWREVGDPRTGYSIASMLGFLRTIAPRVGFDYVDEILERAADNYGRTRNIRLAFKEALKKVAESWTTADNVRRYYGMIFLGEDIFQKGPGTPEETIEFVKGLTWSVYDRVFSVRHSRGLRDCPESYVEAVRYYSNVMGVAACRLPGSRTVPLGILIFRKTRSPLRRVGVVMIRKLGELASTVLELLDAQDKDIRIYELTVVPEGTSTLDLLRMKRALQSSLPGIIVPAGRARRGRSGQARFEGWEDYKLRQEDMAVLLARLLGIARGAEPEDQFVEQRFKDIIAEMSARLVGQ